MDDFLEGGLPLGAVTEWGAPLGHGGREVILAWVASLTSWVLWVHAKQHLKVYPPAWQARGVNLANMRFACTEAPLRDLRPAFLEPLFRLIVLDAPSVFSEDDCAFVARQARANGQVVMVVRDGWLSPENGNVWARLRLNCWHDPAAGQYRLQVVRGLSPRQLALANELWRTNDMRRKEVGHGQARTSGGLFVDGDEAPGER